jgi:hypothetical protein
MYQISEELLLVDFLKWKVTSELAIGAREAAKNTLRCFAGRHRRINTIV